MKKNPLSRKKPPIINAKKILAALPRGASAAILASALGALSIASLVPQTMDSVFLTTFMVLYAVFSLLLELIPLPKFVNVLIPVLGTVGTVTSLFIPLGAEGVNLFRLIMADEITSSQTLIIPCVFFGIVLCWGVGMINRPFVLRYIAAGGIGVSLIILVLMKMTLMPVITALLLTYLLIVTCQIFTPKAKSENRKRNEPWYVIICLAAVVIALLLPKPESRIPWEKWFPQKNTEALDAISEALKIDQLVEKQKKVGFEDTITSLGGWLRVTTGRDVEISFIDGVTTSRIAGSVYDCYTGSRWMSTVPVDGIGYTSESDVDPGSDRAALAELGLARARILKLSTTDDTAFVPPYTVSVYVNDQAGVKRERSQLVYWGKHTGSHMAFFSTGITPHTLTESEREMYLALPDELPARVRELARLLTSGKEDDYARAEALKNALSLYTYETQVSFVPEGSDFVDHFLFTTREGYCMYFASAMAVMARCEGIPSRLVIGYAVPNSSEPTIRVGSANAHAWAEVFIDGIGWVICDPVPENASAFTTIESAVEESEEPEEKELFDEEDIANLKTGLLYTYAATAGFIALFFIFRPFVRRLISRIQLIGKHRHNPGFKVLRRFQRLLWALSACGLKREYNETTEEFGKRATTNQVWMSRVAAGKIRQLIAQTDQVLYSPVAFKDKKVVRGAAHAVRWSYLRTHGLFRYIRGWWRARI